MLSWLCYGLPADLSDSCNRCRRLRLEFNDKQNSVSALCGTPGVSRGKFRAYILRLQSTVSLSEPCLGPFQSRYIRRHIRDEDHLRYKEQLRDISLWRGKNLTWKQLGITVVKPEQFLIFKPVFLIRSLHQLFCLNGNNNKCLHFLYCYILQMSPSWSGLFWYTDTRQNMDRSLLDEKIW